MGREGVKRNFFFRNYHFRKKFFEKSKIFKKIGVFPTFFMGQGGGSPGKSHFFSIGGVNFCLREED